MSSKEKSPASKSWRRRILRVGVVVLSLGLLGSWFVGGFLVSPKPSVVGDIPDDLQGESFTIKSDSGSDLAAWHIKAQTEKPRGVIVLLHPLGFPRRTLLGRVRMLSKAGYACLLFDFQAHGESPGETVTFGHLERFDVKAGVEKAKALYPALPVGVIGWSLGGAAALFASPLGVDALVLEAVYTDIEKAVTNRVALFFGPFAWLPSKLLLLQVGPRLGVSPNELRPIEKVAEVACPVLVIGGAEDSRTPEPETRAMFEAVKTEKKLWLVPGADHIDLHKHAQKDYEKRVLGFFADHLK